MNWYSKSINRMAFSFLISLLISGPSFAFKFNPMTQEISLSQKQNRAVYSIDNDSDKPIAVEISVKRRIMNKDGSEEHPAVENSLLSVFPEQMIIPAKDKRTIRVTWNGKEPLEKEEAFRVIAEQLPVNLNPDEKEAGIKMLLRYVAALYVNPGRTKADLKLKTVDIQGEFVEFHFENKGSKHQIINNLEITLENKDQKIILGEADLKNIWGENVLAQTQRVFRLEKKAKLKNLNSQYKASLSFND